MFKNLSISVVIPSAGSGERMRSANKKQFISLNGKPMIVYTLDLFNQLEFVKEIALVVNHEDREYCYNEIVNNYNLGKVKKIVTGGENRTESVYNGMLALSEDTDLVIIHDGVRPFVDKDVIIETVKEATIHRAAVCGVPVKDTIKVLDSKDGYILNTPDRERLWAVQTPQVFEYKLLIQAYDYARHNGLTATDDSALVEKLGIKVRIVQSGYDNIKITTPEDLILSNYILDNRRNDL